MAENQLQETNPLRSNQLCIALERFPGQQDGDLSFSAGEKIWIVKPCDLMFWYVARNQQGQTGVVPSNFLKPVEEEATPGVAAVTSSLQKAKMDSTQSSTKPGAQTTAEEDDGYIQMNPQEIEEARKADYELGLAQAKEKHRRLHPGTLVVGMRPFLAQEETDLSFNVYEEMTILKALPDLCWYHAQKTDKPSQKGAIPITHVRLVYMSDDEDNHSPPSTEELQDSSLYDDVNDFLGQSGWFSYQDLPQSKEALHRVLARLARMPYDHFMSCKEAVYKFDYRNGEKVFVGKAKKLHVDLSKHFDQFETKPNVIRPIDDELCHHTNIGGWELTVWPLQAGLDLEVECAKKIIEFNALLSDGNGITDLMTFTSKASFETFWNWFSPP